MTIRLNLLHVLTDQFFQKQKGLKIRKQNYVMISAKREHSRLVIDHVINYYVIDTKY